jgi:hypothetical protein
MNEFMTKEEARQIRARQLQGLPVTARELKTAIWTLSKKTDKPSVPKLPRYVRDHANAVLIFNLGQAIGAGSRQTTETHRR